MFTLKQMRDDLRLRINQSGSTDNLVWEDSELDIYVRDAVYFVADHGRYELIQKSFTVDTSLTLSGTALFTKPSDYYRFVAAEIDNVWVNELSILKEQKFIEGNDKLKGDSERKYLYEYDSTRFEVRPTNTITAILHYIKEILTTELNTDSSISPLTNTGDRYALQYAYALVLSSKLYKNEVAEPIFNRIEKQIK